MENTLCLWTDGGVIQRNPSPFGGTFAWVRTENGVEVACAAGLLLPADIKMPVVTNNNSELYALIDGIVCLPENWHGTVYTDSQIALNWVKYKKQSNAIPAWLREAMQLVLSDAEQKGVHLEYQHIKGHPTEEELADETANGVSHYNVRCDALCTAQAAGFARTHNLKHKTVTTTQRKTDRPKKQSPPRKTKIKVTQEGQPCRRCNTPVKKIVTTAKPKAGQRYRYEWFLKCPNCYTPFMPLEAMILLDEQGRDLGYATCTKR